MSDRIMLLLTTKTTALAAIYIHGLHELLFAIHALKLNVNIAGRRSIVFFVLVTFLQNFCCFNIFFFYFIVHLLNFFRL